MSHQVYRNKKIAGKIMKKSFFIILLAGMTFLMCGGKNKDLGIRQHALTGDTVTYESQKWYDQGNTFALRVYALPIENPANSIQAIATCEQALRVNAGAQLVGFFNGVIIEDSSASKNAQLTGMATSSHARGLMVGLRLHEVAHQKDWQSNPGCTAIAVVSQKGLRRKVKTGAYKIGY